MCVWVCVSVMCVKVSVSVWMLVGGCMYTFWCVFMYTQVILAYIALCRIQLPREFYVRFFFLLYILWIWNKRFSAECWSAKGIFLWLLCHHLYFVYFLNALASYKDIYMYCLLVFSYLSSDVREWHPYR